MSLCVFVCMELALTFLQQLNSYNLPAHLLSHILAVYLCNKTT